VGGIDNFDVSLASGYNVPVLVKAKISRDLRWKANHLYGANEQIIEKVDGNEFAFSAGAPGSSGGTRPAFPSTMKEQVTDGEITWTNDGPWCTTSGCKAGGIDEASCPPALRVMDGDDYVACDAPANVCIGTAECAQDKAYYQCTNFDGETDLFGNLLVLQSPNAETPVCFAAEDCPNGTTCQRDPEFVSDHRMTKGAGLCTPVSQNGGCSPGDDGLPCPARGFPFVDYQCQTLKNVATNAQACIPPRTRGYGELWWNGANWTHAPTPSPTPAGTPSGTPSPTPVGTPSPTPTPLACTSDSDCAAWQKCLTLPDPTPPPIVAVGLKQCPPGDNSCTCWNPQRCTAATCPGANQCLNEKGIPDGELGVDCSNPATEPDGCYCSPQGVYSGTCGASNAKWLRAARQLGEPGARWPWTFKDACPIAYSYQFDDPSSDWSCPNPDASLNNYVVTFCSDRGVPD
jgi:hypothetical protein